MARLCHLSENLSSELLDKVDENIERYLTKGFADLMWAPGWSIELTFEYNPEPLNHLDFSDGQEADLKNSLIVWEVFGKLPPALACENRIWTRLAHVECIDYARARWLDGVPEEKQGDSIRKHFFADTLTKYRDDNAISRLWWNAYIANLIYPLDYKKALGQILATADFRSSFIERPWVSSRPRLAGAIVNAMIEDPWVTEKEKNYRDFMKSINREGGGVLFEAMNDNDVRAFIEAICTDLKRNSSGK